MELDHTAVVSADIEKSVEWYKKVCGATVIYQDSSWAFLRVGQGKLALVSPGQHPQHVALRVTAEELAQGSLEFNEEIATHRDGTRGIYIKDLDGNAVEMIVYPEA